MATSQQDIDNSEQLLDLSNKILDSITQRKKLLQGINAEEQSFLNEVRKQQRLSQDIFGNSEKYLKYQVKSKDLAKQIKKTTDDQAKFETLHSKQRSGLINQVQNAQQNVVAFKAKEKSITKQILNLDRDTANAELHKQLAIKAGMSGNAKLYNDQIKANQYNAKIKEKELERLKAQHTKQNSILYSTSSLLKNSLGIKKANDDELDLLRKNLEVRKRIEKSTGALGALAKAATKLPGIGQYLNAPEAIEEMEQLASEIESAGEKSTSFTNRLKIGLKGVNVLAKGFVENITSPEAIFSLIITSTLKANTQVVALGKALGSSSEAYRENLVDISRTTNNLNVSTTNLAEAFNEIVKATGFAYNFSADQLVTQIKLTKQVGLTADEAAQVQRYGALTGKTSEETYRSFLKGIVATRNQLKVGIDFKTTLAEVAKVSGQIAANLGFNPERIAQAVVTAKALGLTFDQLKSATSSLLDFSSSIENELKAELLTGKQLNLERARAAALAGDQVALAEELAKNIGTAADFTRLNVLQQDALSKAVGMTSDQLAETLRRREEAIASGKSLAQITEEEAAQALERQSIQDKFQAATLKLQDLLGNIVAGPLAGFLDVLSGALNIVNKLGNALSFLATPLQVIAGLFLAIKGYQLASLVITKSMAFFEGITAGIMAAKTASMGGQITGQIALSILKKQELATQIGIAAAYALANPFKALLGLGIAAAVSAGLYSMSKADDFKSEGYGKRTLLAPEVTFKFNDKDTIIAGTNLNRQPSQSSDTSALSKSIDSMHNTLKQSINKPSVAFINGEDAFARRLGSNSYLGTSQNMDTAYQMA